VFAEPHANEPLRAAHHKSIAGNRIDRASRLCVSELRVFGSGHACHANYETALDTGQRDGTERMTYGITAFEGGVWREGLSLEFIQKQSIRDDP